MFGQPRLTKSLQWSFPRHSKTKVFGHVKGSRVLTRRQREFKALHKPSQTDLHEQNAQRHAGALPPAGTERNQLEMGSSDSDLGVPDEPLGIVFQRFLPPVRVSLDGVDVDYQLRVDR